MFTECPECSTGFRVTAKVLAQAGGRVRCGGCGNAFSALEHLTEELPGMHQHRDEPPSDDEKFKETSRQLLKTLDELAGPEEVVIEDTGLEWRVLDEDEVEVAAEAAPTVVAPIDDSDELLVLEDEAQEPLVEQSYDDDTPLSDDDDDDDKFAARAAPAEIPAEAAPPEEIVEVDEEQVDPVLHEPEEWTGLLEEVDDDEGDDMPLEVEEELAAIHSELSAKDDPLPVDLDAQFDMQAEAMGLEITGSQEIVDDEGTAAEAGHADAEATEIAPTAEDNDLTDVAVLDEEEDGEEIAADALTLADDGEDDVERAEIAAVEEPEAEADPTDLEPAEEMSSQDVLTAEQERELDAMIHMALAESAGDSMEEPEQTADDAAQEPEYLSIEDEEEPQDLSIEDAEEPQNLSIDPPEVPEQLSLDPAEAPEHSAGDEIPEQSEEEMTINQQIDQELLAIASKDEHLKATIIGLENAGDMFDEGSPEVETIIMEGDVVRGAMEREREKEKRERALARFDNAGNLIDSYIANRAKRGGRRSTDPPGYGAIAGTALLALMLAGQGINAYREELSTFELFDKTIAPIYRMLGKPITPEWDITGWQFESTNGRVAEDANVLTISSRIGNRSEQPLPYPLVHVSLTDRWEEIIGRRVLEPNEYLPGDLDPSKPVLPGDNFTAVITVDEPSVEATGFKVNVCYRVSPGRVRCATEDFKN